MTTQNGNGAGDPEALREEIRRTRAELGETVQALAARADVKARMKQSADETKARVRQRAAAAGERVREQAGQTADAVRASVYDAGLAARRNPVPWAAIGLGVLAAVVVILVTRGKRR